MIRVSFERDVETGETLGRAQYPADWDALERVMNQEALGLLAESQADRDLDQGGRYACESGHGWHREGPGRHGPHVPGTAVLGPDGQPVSW